jgi:hypothetical protein
LNNRVGRETDIVTRTYADQFRTRRHSRIETSRCSASACRYACSERTVSALDVRYRHILDWHNGKKSGRRLDRQISSRVIDVLDYVLPKLQIGMGRINARIDVRNADVPASHRQPVVERCNLTVANEILDARYRPAFQIEQMKGAIGVK